MASAYRRAATIEPLHPRHSVASFECADYPYLVEELHQYADDAPYVVGQRVLVSCVDDEVTGFLALTDVELEILDEGAEWHCLFVSSMAVSDSRRNSRDAEKLTERAMACIRPGEIYGGQDYRAVVIDPSDIPELLSAAAKMGFRPNQDGKWYLELRPHGQR